MHDSIRDVGQWPRSVVMEHCRYIGVPGNYSEMNDLRNAIVENWIHVLRRKGQKRIITWEKMRKLADRSLPRPQICHKHPYE